MPPLLFLQVTAPVDSHGLFYAWVGLNSVAVLGIVFHAGKVIERLSNVEKRLESHASKLEAMHSIPTQFNNLCERVDEIQEGQQKIQLTMDSIKESIFKLTYKS